MRKLWIFSVVIFILALAAFGYTKFLDRSRDQTSPVVTMDAEQIEVSVQSGKEALLRGVTAVDDRDGDVTGSLVVESCSNFIEDGTRIVYYAAFDGSGNVGKAQRTVKYTDYTAPEFHLSQPLIFQVNSVSLVTSLTATDCLDGDITRNIKIGANSRLSTTAPGDYRVEFTLTNSAGDMAQLPVTVTVQDKLPSSAPQIRLSDYLVYLNLGEKLDPRDLIESFSVDEEDYEGETAQQSKSLVKLDGEIDTDTPGVYEVTYSLKDSRDYEGLSRLIVIVQDSKTGEEGDEA